MPNHYVNQVHIIGAPEDCDDAIVHWGRVLAPCFADGDDRCGLLSLVLPMPEAIKVAPGDAWYRWALGTWGTKWGAYDHQPLRAIGGDISGVVCAFETAWSAPHEQARNAVAAWLLARGARRVAWVGLDPYDNSVALLGQWPAKENR